MNILRVIRGTIAWLFDKLGFAVSIQRKTVPDAGTALRKRFPGVEFWVAENVTIGERVSIMPGALLVADSPIEIGDDTMIGARTIINTVTHDHHNHPMWREKISRPIKIGKHVWIGLNVIILPGITVGDYAVIGAGSVVTSHVPAGAIVTGNPARIIDRRDLEKIKTIDTRTLTYPDSATVKREPHVDPRRICKEISSESANNL